MRNIKMIIEYDGSRYSGWQRLKNSDETIQGKLESVISQMLDSSIEIIGSGRTDAGVHARGQVANFQTKSNMSAKEMLKYMNYYLPQDIVVKEVTEVPERFHSRYNVKGKKYVYYIWNHWIPSAFERKYAYHLPEKLNIGLMEEAAEKLIGTHDFIGFSSVKKTNKSTTRTIEEIKILQEENMIKFIFIGNGFLYNMVRIMMGSLVEIGSKHKAPSYIDEILESKVRSIAGQTLPPQGLFLEEVYY